SLAEVGPKKASSTGNKNSFFQMHCYGLDELEVRMSILDCLPRWCRVRSTNKLVSIGSYTTGRKPPKRRTPRSKPRSTAKNSTADSYIEEALPVQVITGINVLQIDHDGACHALLHFLKVKGAELLPFGDDHQPVGTFGARIGPIAKGHIREH